MKKKVADLGDMNTKLGLTVSKQQQLIDAHAKDAEALERKWRRKCEGLTRQLRELRRLEPRQFRCRSPAG